MEKDLLKCDYCAKTRHTKELCWKVHDHPSRGQGDNGGGVVRSHAHLTESADPIFFISGPSSSTSSDSTSLTTDEI